MTRNQSELLAEVRADFEALLNLVTGAEAQAATVNQMERSLLRQLLAMGRKLLQLFLTHRAETESHAPQYGWQRQKFLYHSQKTVDYLSVCPCPWPAARVGRCVGKLEVRRAYFYAPGAGGKTPLDRALSLPARCYSDLLMECAELLAVDSAYDKATQVMARLLGVEVSVLALETSVAEQSQVVQPFSAQREAFPRQEEGPILVVQADGKGVRLVRDDTAPTGRRGKGDKKTHKKEAIAVAVYTIAPYRRTPQEVVAALFQDEVPAGMRPVPQHKQVFASLDGKATALRRLARWAAQREGRHIRQRVALTDGAEALQVQMRHAFPTFTLVLDLIHVVEHLWSAGTALYGETDPQREAWVRTQTLDILSSRGAHVVHRLEESLKTLAMTSQAAKALRRVAGYLQRNQPYMDYAHYLKWGWPIGTGVIEGACRHLVKDRMELSGMRWTIAGAEALLALRAVQENGDWDTFHQFRREQRHKRLYGKPLIETWINPVERLEINQI